MSGPHVFVETNFLNGVFHMPSKRNGDALALLARFQTGEIKIYVPYLCFQEAANKISRMLPRNRCEDLFEFHRFAASQNQAPWDFQEAKKLLDAAGGEVNRTKAVYKRELADFRAIVGDGVLHGTAAVFDFLESLELDDDSLKYNDKLILSSVLVKAKELHDAGVSLLFFASTDTSDLGPTSKRPKMAQYYHDAGLTFIPGFVIPDPTPGSSSPSPQPTLP
jgi:predicted nucleic acid-binding protein